MYQRDGHAIGDLMQKFNSQSIQLDKQAMQYMQQLFTSATVDDQATCATIAKVYEESEYMLDPHSAIGVHAARLCRGDRNTPTISLATAHPAKFPDAIKRAAIGAEPQLPHTMQDLFEREERYTVVANDLTTVNRFITDNIA